MDRVNLHIYPSPFTHESRIQKETKSMVDAGLVDRLYMVGVWVSGCPEIQQVDEKRQIWRVRPRLGSQDSGLFIKSLRYIEWQLRIFFGFRSQRVLYVNCHSLPVLPLGVLFKFLKRSILIYDTHELETEVVGLVGSKRILYKLVERGFIHFADAVITVNESISDWYRNTYGLKNVTSIRNVPYQPEFSETSQENLLKRKFRLVKDDILFICQGNFGPGRGIEILLEVFSKASSQKHIVFMGFGELEKTIRDYEERCYNIHFQPGVPPNEVSRYTRGADVGLCLLENIGLSYYLSLPNKFFEYIINGVPAVVSDFPEMARVIDEGHCGWKVSADRDEFFRLVEEISWDDIQKKHRNALEYRKSLGWHHEEKSLIQVYRNLNEGNSE